MKTLTKTTDIDKKFQYIFMDKLSKKPVFFDIETTGLSAKSSSIYMIGVSYPEGDSYFIKQWFCEKEAEEESVIKAFLDFLNDRDLLLHFNGLTFDIPFIKAIAADYDIEISPHVNNLFSNSLDLYGLMRPLKKAMGLSALKATDLEKLLGLYREGDHSGKELISVYRSYLENNSYESEESLFFHNFCDVEGGILLTCLLSFVHLFKPKTEEDFSKYFSLDSLEKTEDFVKINLYSKMHFPKEHTFVYYDKINENEADSATSNAPFKLHIKGQRITLIIPCLSLSLRYYYKNYKDYYYLPEEDRIIHKSLAHFIGSALKEKAVRTNCFIPHDSIYIPTNIGFDNRLKLFKSDYTSKKLYIEVRSLSESDALYYTFCLLSGIGTKFTLI